jgi:tetratricopeptide (TPR) repeat protein
MQKKWIFKLSTAIALMVTVVLPGAALAARAPVGNDGNLCGMPLSQALREAARSRDIQSSKRATEAASACNRVPEAWAAAQRWRKLDPEAIDALQAYWVAAIETYKVEQARDAFSTLLQRDDVDADRMLSELVPSMRLGGQGAATWQAIAPLLQTDKLANESLLMLADLAVDSGDFAAGRRYAQAVLANDKSRHEASLLLAQIDAAEGRDEQAVAAVQSVLANSPKANRFALVDMLIGLERNEDAEQALQAMRDREADDQEIARRLALLALQQNDLETARARFAAMLGSNPGEALFFLAQIAERRGEHDSALDAYMRLVRAGAGLRPRARAASLLLGKGKDEEARKLIDDYSAAGGQEAIDGVNAWSQVLIDADRDDAAVEVLREALKATPGHPGLEYQLGLTLAQIGRNREAIAQLEKFWRSRPQDPNAMNALGYTLADSGVQLPRAEQLIRDALKPVPDNAALIDSLGWVRFRRGDNAGALRELERAWQLSRNPEIAAHWGEVLWAAGRQGEARSVWARGLARDPDSAPLKATIERLTGGKGQ